MSAFAHPQPLTRDQQGRIPGRVMLLSPPEGLAEALVQGLKEASQELILADSSAEGLARMTEEAPDVVLVPVELRDTSGLAFLRELSTAGIDCGVVLVLPDDAHSTSFVEELELDTLQFMVPPLSVERTIATLSLVVTSRRLRRENEVLRRQLNVLGAGEALVGCSPAARRLSGALARVAESSSTVLIEGQRGTGKTLAAQIIHANSRRSAQPLVIEQCQSMPLDRLERALASGGRGSLLLEDVEGLHPDAQSKIVRFIKELAGSSAPNDHVRIIATTSGHLPELVARGKFREDLFYRLNVFPIVVPSLQERRDDIILLAHHFFALAGGKSRDPETMFSADAMNLLETLQWPGNVGQLQDVIFRAHALAGEETIDRQHLLGPATGLSCESASKERQPVEPKAEDDEEIREEDILPLETEEKRLFARALKATKGNVRRASQLLRIGRATLYRKIQVYKLKLN